MAIRISLFSKWLLVLVVFQLICTIGLSVGSEDDDLGISSSKLKGSSEDLKSDFSFESERQSPASSPNSKLKTSEELKLEKNGNLLENDEYIVQDDESEDDGYIVQDNESEDGYVVQDDESDGDGYIAQDDKNDLPKLQSKISSKSTSNVHTPDNDGAQSIKPSDDSNDIPTGRKDVYHYGNASPKAQSSGKHPEASSSLDDGKTSGDEAIQPPKKSKLSTWEKAQLMMMKRNKNKIEKETQQKGDEIVVGSPFISLDAKASSLVSEKSLDVKHSDSSQRNESSENIDFPQSGKLSSNDVDVGGSAIEESREKFIKQPVSVEQDESAIASDSSDGDIDNNLKSRKDVDKDVSRHDRESERSDSKVSPTGESHLSKNIKSGKDEGDGTIDQEGSDGISEDDIDASQSSDEDQDKDDAGGQESDTNLENVKEVKNEVHAAENRGSLDSKVLSSSKDDFKDEVANSSNSEEGSTHNLMNKSISDVKGVSPKPTTYVEKGAVEKVNITSDVLTRDELKVDLEHIYPDDANDTDGNQSDNTKDIDRIETDGHDDKNENKYKGDTESETVGRDAVSTAGNVASFGKDTLDRQMESLDGHSVKDQTNLVVKDLENVEDEQDVLIKEDSEKDSEEINKDSQSSDSALANNNSELSKDIYDNNDIKQVNESGAKEGPVKNEIKKDDGEGTQMSKPPIRDVSDDSDSDKSDGKEMDEDTKDIETKKDNKDNVEIDDEKPMDGKDSQSSDSPLVNNNSELSKDIYDDNDIKQVNESGAKEGPVKDEIKKDDGEGTQMSKPPIRDVSDDSGSDKSDDKEMDEDTKDIETKKNYMDNVEIDDEKPKDGKDSEEDTENDGDVEAREDTVERTDERQANNSVDQKEYKSHGKKMDEGTKNIESKENATDIVDDGDDEDSEDDDTADDEDVEAGEDAVEGTDKQQADNYIEKGDDMNVDDGHVDNDAKKVEDNDENESEDIDSENVVLEIDAKLSDDLIDGSEQNINDDKNIDKVYRNAHKEGEVRDNVAKDGDGKTSYTNADGNAENMEATRDKNNIEEENKQVVDKLSNNEDENISGNNKSPKKDDENVNRFDEEQIGDKKGHKDAEINSENVDVSLDSKDDESGNETLDEPSKDDDEISDVDDFEGSKKDDNSIAKNDQYKDVTKDDNNNDVNEKDSKTSVGSVVDTNKIVNKTSSNHTTARNATFFEEINSKKMQKDDSFEEDITDNKTQVYQDDQTSTGARESEGKRLNKDVIDGGDAPGLIFEDVPTYVEITRDHDERGTDADINDGTINVDVDGGSDGPIAFDPTPAPSLEAAPSNKDATADSETSVKDMMDSEKLDVAVAKNVVDSLKEMSDFESSISQEADKESAKNEDISNIIAEVDKDISNDIETTETSNLEHEEVMSDSTVNTNEYEVHTNTADERKAISTPDARGQVGKVGSYESEKESLIESDEKNLDDIPQEPDVSTGQLFPSEHVKAKDESQSVEDDSNFSDIPSRIDKPKVTSDVEGGKMTENERVVDNENADDHKQLTGASEEMTEAKDDGKIAEDEDVKADGKMVEVLDVKVDEKMVEDLDVKADEKMVEDLDVKADEKMVEDLDLKVDEKMVEDLDVKVDEGNVEKDVEKYFQDTTLQSTRKNWVFFTIKPYISLLKTVMKKLDPFITGIIFMLPPSMQNIFLKAPFNMYPTHAFLLFTLSCFSLFVISFSKIFKGNKQHSKSKELKEMLFETKGVLLLSQVERDEAEKKLQDLKAKLKQKDDDLESGTVEMNKNLKALIKECDALKEEVSRRMESSKEMKRDMKKAESDIQKQLLANKELQESITSAKSHVQQLQDKRDQLQSSVDESELNSMKLEEKIQCLSEDVEAVEESYDQLRTEVESKLKESGELQTTVDLLKERCSKKSGDIETKEKENKILREAIVQLKIMKHLQEEDKDDDDDDDGCDDDKKEEKLEERIKHLIYIAQMRSSMDEIEEEKESLKKSLTGAAEKKMDLNDELKRTMEEIEKVEQLREDAERQATASTMKIDVLSDYYKQREKEYNKMLQEKEAKEKAISSQKKSANERYREVDKMVADYKNQVEVLTQELERIGIHYEKQMALQENKLQENLVFVKQTERDYNIKVKEAEIMRQRLLQYRERINLLESMMASHKSTETLNTSQTKEDIRPASRNLLLRENMPSPNFMPPSFSPHPSSLGPVPPQFFNPPPFMMRHPFIPPRLPMRSREDSPTLQRIRESDDFLDERDHYPTSRARSPLRFGPSPACRNRSSPVELKDKYTPLANNRPLDPFYMEKGDGSHRTKYSDK